MGRHRTYDSDKVLEAARDAFWTYGYEGTSVADLCRVTGLEKGSLYHAFGDKKQLFFESSATEEPKKAPAVGAAAEGGSGEEAPSEGG